MMFHQLILLGNLGRDPEMRFSGSGTAVCNFSMATTRKYQKNGEWVSETCWFRVSSWGKLAEAANKNLKKGAKVMVIGRLTSDPATGGPRVWEAKDGGAKSSFEVMAENIRFLDPKPQEAEQEEIPF